MNHPMNADALKALTFLADLDGGLSHQGTEELYPGPDVPVRIVQAAVRALGRTPLDKPMTEFETEHAAWKKRHHLQPANCGATVEVERIEKAALQFGYVVYAVARPLRHGDLFKKLSELGLRAAGGEQGFMTNAGRFVDRVEGLAIAAKARQLTSKHGQRIELYSEDMW